MESIGCATLLESLDPVVRSSLRGIMHEVSFPAGEQIFAQGDPASSLYIVVSGQVKVMRVTNDRYKMILCVLGPGGCFCPLPILDGGSQLGMSQAATDVTLLCAKAADFRELYNDYPQLADALIKNRMQDMRRLVARLELLTFKSLKKRLAGVLLEQSVPVQTGHTTLDEIHLTQQELAQLVGVSRESVSHLLAMWEREDLLIQKRRRLIIRRPDIIEQLA